MDENIRMEDILAEEEQNLKSRPQRGAINELEIVGFTEDSVLVDVGRKSEGIIPKLEFPQEILNNLQLGSKISVFVYSTVTDSNFPRISFKKALEIGKWNVILEKKANNETIKGRIEKHIKGGLIVDLNGLEAFLPASQIDIRPVSDVKSWVGRDLDFYIIEAVRNKNNIVISRRKILEEERDKVREKVFNNLNIGDVITGRVTRVSKFGAFVDINGFEGLLHEKELSWDKNVRFKGNIEIDQELELKVIGLNKEEGKIFLSRRALLPHPWDGIEERFPVGSTIEGVISSITNFGAFITVDKGVEGLAHTSEFSWRDKNLNISKRYKTGDSIRAKVITIDRGKEKIGLSIKRLEENPWEKAKESYKPGTRLTGKVSHMVPFGAFVDLEIGVEGLIHVSDIDWVRKIKHPKEVLTLGKSVEVAVIGVNVEEEKISLSLKELKENPFKKYKTGVVVNGTVKKIMNYGAFVNLETGIDAFLHISEIYFETDDPKSRLKHPKDAIHEKQQITAKIIAVNTNERTIDLSMKKYEKDIQKQEMNKYLNNNERPTLGDLLGQNTTDD
ncbi:MAG: S1 RNA-binding domain-containing protein [bacterium]